MVSVEDLKTKPQISREDIGALLASIGKPGQKQKEKISAVEELERFNKQGHNLSESLPSYSEF